MKTQPPPEASEDESATPPQGDEAETEGSGVNATPEEQAQLKEFVHNGALLVYDKALFNSIVQRFRAANNDPVSTLANLGALIVKRLYDSAKGQLDPAVILNGAPEILGMLAEISEKAGAHKFTDKEIEAAFYKGADQFRSIQQQSGNINQDQAKADWDEMKAADQSGALDKALPVAREHYGPAIAATAKRPGMPAPSGNRKARRAAAAKSRQGMPQPSPPNGGGYG